MNSSGATSTTSPQDASSPSPTAQVIERGTARLTFAQDGFDIDTISVGADDNTADLSLDPLNQSRLADSRSCTNAWNIVDSIRPAGAGGATKGFGVNSLLCLTTSDGNTASLRVEKIHDSTDANDWWIERDVIVWGVK
ncbi:hypothetical protein HII36_13320 [Nonomuraea sp. NN258]|uniref:hypothetical protein n=1 Tax=Nonomuraea antri TaxID=2730852 RepID=UPI001568B591|nr:hypothetical protein [Nonomuraea antri]NRQ32813.1 hypothetical protein [Nonomuraea antri]